MASCGVQPAANDWPTTQGDIAGTAYSTLTQINTRNVAGLKKVWEANLESAATSTTWPPQNQPIVVSGKGKNLPLDTGTMFISTNTGAAALDPTNGTVLWRYQGPLIDPVTKVPGRSNVRTSRAQDYGKGMLFVGQQDRSIVALSAKTGAVIWTAQQASYGTFGEVSRQASSARPSSSTTARTGSSSRPRTTAMPPCAASGRLQRQDRQAVWRTWNTPDPSQFAVHPLVGESGRSGVSEAAPSGRRSRSTPSSALVSSARATLPVHRAGRPGKNLWTTA